MGKDVKRDKKNRPLCLLGGNIMGEAIISFEEMGM